MKTTPFDHIRAGKPVNKLAAMQAARGEEWEPKVELNPHGRRWREPPATMPVRDIPAELRCLIGKKVGRMTVIGCLGRLNPKKKPVWLCRCVCGDYTTRGARAIKFATNPNDMCEHCWHLEKVKLRVGDASLAQMGPGRGMPK